MTEAIITAFAILGLIAIACLAYVVPPFTGTTPQPAGRADQEDFEARSAFDLWL